MQDLFKKVLSEIRESQSLLRQADLILKQSVTEEEIKKVRKTLSQNKYKDPDSGNEVSFSTAFSRGIPKAKEDYEKALKSAPKEKVDKKEDNRLLEDLNEEQIDLLERVAQGRDVSDMSMVEERVLRESISILLDAQGELEEEGEEEPQKKAPAKEKKEYTKKVKKKLEEKIEEVEEKVKEKTPSKKTPSKKTPSKKTPSKKTPSKEDDDLEWVDINELIDLDELSEIHSEDANPMSTALDKDISSREKALGDFWGEEEEEEATQNRDHILKDLKESINSISSKAQKDLDEKIKSIEESLKDNSLTKAKKKELQEELEDLQDEKDILLSNIKESQKGYEKALERALDTIPNFDVEQSKALAESYSDTAVTLVSKVDDFTDLDKFIKEEMKDLCGSRGRRTGFPWEDEDSSGSDTCELDEEDEFYPEKLGKLLALKAMKEEVLENPTFGFTAPSLDSDPVFLEEYKYNLQEQQRTRFKSFNSKQREEATYKLQAEIEDLKDIINDPNATKADKNEAERKLMVAMESQSALNAARLIAGEEPIEGFLNVDLKYIEYLKDIKEEGDLGDTTVFEHMISDLSRDDYSNEEIRSRLNESLKAMPQKQWEYIMREGDLFDNFSEIFEEGYCPNTPENEAAGVAGNTGVGNCPSPVSKEMLESVKDSITNNFLDVQTAYRRSPSKKKAPSVKSKNKQLANLLKNHRDDFFSVILEGTRADGSSLKKKEREEYMSLFFSELRVLNLKNLKIQGIKVEGIDGLIRKINRIRSLKGAERSKEIEVLRKVIEDLMGLDPIKKKSHYFNNPFINSGYTCGGVSMHKKSTVYADYQERAKAFEKGMRVYTFWEGNNSQPGVVVAVYPAIGMVDVQYPHGSQRVPVEELIVDTSGDAKVMSSPEVSIPGGLGVTPVSARVARRYMKKSMYWKEVGRKYQLCKGEDPRKPSCPKCKMQMGMKNYKRRDGLSERLLACPSCLFIIKTTDVEGVN